RKLCEDALLGTDELVAALVRQPPVLLCEEGAGLGAGDREGALELRRALIRLGLDQRVEPCLRLEEGIVFGLALAAHRIPIVGEYLSRWSSRPNSSESPGRRPSSPRRARSWRA